MATFANDVRDGDVKASFLSLFVDVLLDLLFIMKHEHQKLIRCLTNDHRHLGSVKGDLSMNAALARLVPRRDLQL